MKISKKIFGVALALIMIFNVFAVGTYAAVPADTLVMLYVDADKTTYAPGDEITLTFSAEVLPELQYLMIGGQYEIGYNSAVLEPYANSNVLTDHAWTAIQNGADLGISGVQLVAQSSGPSPLYDWNTTICYVVADTDVVFDATSKTGLFSIKMKIKADAPDGTYTIGLNPLGYEECNAYINDGLGLGGLYGASAADYGFSVNNMYGYGTCTFTVSSAPAVEVTHTGEQAKWNGGNANNTAENYLFGFLGNVTGLTVETSEQDGHDVITNIQSIVATAEYNGTTVTSNVITMWEEADGSYGFRAVFAGFDPADTKELSVTFAITMSDGTTEYTTQEVSEDTPNAIYLAAVERGMPALAA